MDLHLAWEKNSWWRKKYVQWRSSRATRISTQSPTEQTTMRVTKSRFWFQICISRNSFRAKTRERGKWTGLVRRDALFVLRWPLGVWMANVALVPKVKGSLLLGCPHYANGKILVGKPSLCLKLWELLTRIKFYQSPSKFIPHQCSQENQSLGTQNRLFAPGGRRLTTENTINYWKYHKQLTVSQAHSNSC